MLDYQRVNLIRLVHIDNFHPRPAEEASTSSQPATQAVPADSAPCRWKEDDVQHRIARGGSSNFNI